MKKRLLSLLLALALLCAMLPRTSLPAAAAGTGVALNSTNFPDESFLDYVRGFDSDGSGTLSADEIANVTNISCPFMSIKNLKGIEYFTAITALNCSYNQLTTLDLSKNTALLELSCEYNQLTALDVSKNTALEYLSCNDNQLTALDLSKNTALEHLNCDCNVLTALDVSKNTALEFLSCSDNWLTALDISKNTALDTLDCSCNGLSALDLGGLSNLRCMLCYRNKLTALDVSENHNLEAFYCDNNQLTELDLSGNPYLSSFYCEGNKLTELDISNNPMLENLLEEGERDFCPEYCYYHSPDYMYDLSFDPATVLRLSDGTIHCESPFTDVKPGSYYYIPVLWAVDKGITTGTGNGLFSPKQTCTRAQVMTFLWKACDSPEPESTENPFTDVKPGKWYEKAVLWAVENGIATGASATSFGVNQDCTRAQVVTFLWNAAGSPEPETTENPFTDVKPTSYYYKAVLWAVENGIATGTGANTFSPKKTCTRAQVMTFLYNDLG